MPPVPIFKLSMAQNQLSVPVYLKRNTAVPLAGLFRLNNTVSFKFVAWKLGSAEFEFQLRTGISGPLPYCTVISAVWSPEVRQAESNCIFSALAAMPVSEIGG